MISRKLLAALVGFSLAAGTLGTASAQTTAPATAQTASPSDTAMPATAAKSDTMKKALVRKGRHSRMIKKTHRKHVSARGTEFGASKVATKRGTFEHAASKPTGKRVRLSHSIKRGTTKHA